MNLEFLFFSNWWSHRWAIRAKCTGLESNLHKSFCFPGELTTILIDFPYFVDETTWPYIEFLSQTSYECFCIRCVAVGVKHFIFSQFSFDIFSLHTHLLNSLQFGLSIHFCVFLSSSRILRSRMLSEALEAIFEVLV